MKRIVFTVLAAVLFTFAAYAQDETLKPGIYSVIDGSVQHLVYTNGTAISSSTNLIGFEIGNSKFKYKGESGEVEVKDKIIMVINPDKKVIKKTVNQYDPFVKNMTPAIIIIVPLEVVDGKRIYDCGRSVEGINTTIKDRVEFEWELVDDNTYEISAEFEPGEYAVIFRPSKLGEYDFTSIYGFFVR